jgi:RimJ/RimL family protein N-acetyltransferase
MIGSTLNDNAGMLRVTERLGFQLQGLPKGGVVRVEPRLQGE